MKIPTRTVKAALRSLLRLAPLRHQVFLWAARRGRGLILVYHRLGEQRGSTCDIVGSVDRRNFEHQLGVLSHVGEVLPLESALESDRAVDRALRFAITFDDDYQSHLSAAVPILAAAGLPGTFFLNGRIGGDPGPYWWQVLEQAIVSHGLPEVGSQLGSAATSAHSLAAEIESASAGGRVLQLYGSLRQKCEPLLSVEQMQELSGSGVGIGYHGRDHRLMVGLAATDNRECLEVGRRELSRALDRSLESFAYPHGKADLAARAAVRDSDYRYAFTGAGRGFTSASSRVALPRWDPSTVSAEDFETELALRLLLPTG